MAAISIDVMLLRTAAIFIVLAIGSTRSADLSICTTDNAAGCKCELSPSSTYSLKCSRQGLQRVPVITEAVDEVEMFRSSLNTTFISSFTFRASYKLKKIKIDNCDLTKLDKDSLEGLYNLHTLDLKQNKLTALPPAIFKDQTYVSELDLSYNLIEELNGDIFEGLRNLRLLDLSYNNLVLIPEDALRHLSNLRDLRLTNALIEISVLPTAFLSPLMVLEVIDLTDNDLTLLDPKTFSQNPNVGVVRLRNNELTHVSAGVFQNLSQLTSLELNGNPLSCDCGLLEYRTWLDMGHLPASPELLGSCNEPEILQDQYVSTVPLSKFKCVSTTVSTPAAVSPVTKDSHQSNITDQSSSTAQPVSAPLQTTEMQNKKKEKAIIIGMSIFGGILFIALNVLIVCGVKRARSRTSPRKIKYILKPEQLKRLQMEDFYRPAYKTPEINGVGNGYVISNETAGLYHTGSRIRLCDEREDNSSTGYHRTDMTRSQEYIQHKQSREKRIYSIEMEHQPFYQGLNSNCNILATSEVVPEEHLNLSNHGQPYTPSDLGCYYDNRLFYQTDGQENTSPFVYDSQESEPEPYIPFEEYADVIQSSSKLANHDACIRYSTGSGDSGVHSNSPIDPNIQACLTPGTKKKIRNETYV